MAALLALNAATSAMVTPSRGLNERTMPRRAALQGLGAGLVGASLPPLAPAAAAAAPATLATAAAAARTPLVLPPIGIGAWAWGDSLFWGYDKKNDDEQWYKLVVRVGPNQCAKLRVPTDCGVDRSTLQRLVLLNSV